jgi:hypothetical protein
MKDNNKEANSNIDISIIVQDIQYVLEHVARLGRDAHGAYNEKMQELLILSIQQVILQERIKAMQTERAEVLASIIDIAERAEEADLSIDAVINACKLLADSTHN